MYQIWQDRESGVAVLVGNLDKEERRDLLEAGMVMKLEIDSDDKGVAQSRFIEWCKTQHPDAKVKLTNLKKMLQQ